MPATTLEQTLRDLPRLGTRVKDRGYRQVWRFGHDGKAYYLKFYPRRGRDRWRRLFRGSPARREFDRLLLLQKAGAPSPRGVAYLAGLLLERQKGDAVILEAIEPAVPLDEYLNDLELRGEPVPNHLSLAGQVRGIVQALAKAGLGHDDLHLGNFLLRHDKLYLLDAYAVRPGGMKLNDVLRLGQSAARFATRADMVRGWEALGPGGRPPTANRVASRLFRSFLDKTSGENRYFGRLVAGEWSGHYFKRAKYPRPWSAVSGMQIAPEDWQAEWPALLRRIEADELQVLKRTKSGDVLAGEISLAGRTIHVVVKRPRRRYWYRYLNEIGRGARARRAWFKAWKMIVRNVPSAWPLLMMERRAMGYVTDTLVVFERVAGPTLAAVELDAMAGSARDMLFRRAGRLLRSIEQFGFSHFDAKASNWIVLDDERRGPMPVLIDIDGIRQRRWPALGVRRLLRSMQSHPQYSAADSLALCRGYAPHARMAFEPSAPEHPGGEQAQEPGEQQQDEEARPSAGPLS